MKGINRFLFIALLLVLSLSGSGTVGAEGTGTERGVSPQAGMGIIYEYYELQPGDLQFAADVYAVAGAWVYIEVQQPEKARTVISYERYSQQKGEWIPVHVDIVENGERGSSVNFQSEEGVEGLSEYRVAISTDSQAYINIEGTYQANEG
ncbi:hypothetical protein [Paenibacillus shenyangensis]|uniref:hypothetical protein n=1 Tax=Paenibacillus sp. A9 TaxID=1284352 RepID=UPI000381E9C8|nr:hypothetical protein [Paenibacillus sp. A9]